MSKIKLLTIAVIGLLVVNIGIIGYLMMKKKPTDSNPPMGMERRPPGMRERPKKIIADRLHFDKEQIAQYDDLIKEHQAAIQQLDDSIRIAKNNLYRSLATTSLIGRDSLVATLGTFQKQIEIIHYEHFAALKKICKPGQLNDFNELTKELARFFAPGKKEGPPPRD